MLAPAAVVVVVVVVVHWQTDQVDHEAVSLPDYDSSFWPFV